MSQPGKLPLEKTFVAATLYLLFSKYKQRCIKRTRERIALYARYPLWSMVDLSTPIRQLGTR
jgi:hypothetical protein